MSDNITSIVKRTRTGHMAGACLTNARAQQRWHWTLDARRTLCGRPVEGIIDMTGHDDEHLATELECKLCARSMQ